MYLESFILMTVFLKASCKTSHLLSSQMKNFILTEPKLKFQRKAECLKYILSADIFKAIWLQNLILFFLIGFYFKYFFSIKSKVIVEGYQMKFFSVFKVLVKYLP